MKFHSGVGITHHTRKLRLRANAMRRLPPRPPTIPGTRYPSQLKRPQRSILDNLVPKLLVCAERRKERVRVYFKFAVFAFGKVEQEKISEMGGLRWNVFT